MWCDLLEFGDVSSNPHSALKGISQSFFFSLTYSISQGCWKHTRGEKYHVNCPELPRQRVGHTWNNNKCSGFHVKDGREKQ